VIKGFLGFLGPYEFPMLLKIYQWCSKLRKTLDEPPIIAAQLEEAP
jgi:hypothetical protein